MYTEAINHDPAITFFQTGSQIAGRPSMGSWVTYGIGTENSDLPAVAAAMGCGDNVRFLGYTDEATLAATMASSDLLVNLRYPSFGESSGSVARALGRSTGNRCRRANCR